MNEHKYLFPLHRLEARGSGTKELAALLGDRSRSTSGNLPAAKSRRRAKILTDLVIPRNTRGQQSKGQFTFEGSVWCIFRLPRGALFLGSLRLASLFAIRHIKQFHLLRRSRRFRRLPCRIDMDCASRQRTGKRRQRNQKCARESFRERNFLFSENRRRERLSHEMSLPWRGRKENGRESRST